MPSLHRTRARRRYRNRGAIRRLRNLIYDLVGPIDWWPPQVVSVFSRLHMNNRDRFVLTVFLLCNGCDPRIIIQYYRVAYDFDRSAWDQVNYIINRYPQSQWQAWNIHLGRWV